MELLEKEFGNKQLVVNRYLEKLKAWLKVPLNKGKAYKKAAHFSLRRYRLYEKWSFNRARF